MKKKIILGVLALLFIGGAVLYAQNNATLKSGAYRASFLKGEARVLVSNLYGTIYINIFDQNGTRFAIGTARIRGTQMNVDVGNAGFETWTIIDDETFKDEDGYTYHWIRDLRPNEVRRQW